MRVVKIRGDMINRKTLSRAVENALTAEAKAVKVDFDVTTQTWKNRPEFTIDSEPGKRVVSTTDEIFGYVDEGTKPHIITAKGDKPLTFGVGGSPKTTPKVIGSKAGTKGSTIVRKRSVNHPGTTARDFTETIRGKWDDRLADVLQRAIDSEV